MILLATKTLPLRVKKVSFEALLRWVEYDGQRKKDFPDLFRKICLPSMERAYFECRVASNNFVRESKELSYLVAKALSQPDQECGESRKRKSVDNPGFFLFAYADEEDCLKVFSYTHHKDTLFLMSLILEFITLMN